MNENNSLFPGKTESKAAVSLTLLLIHFQLVDQERMVNSEQHVNCSAVVDWREWSCDAGVVFSATHSY